MGYIEGSVLTGLSLSTSSVKDYPWCSARAVNGNSCADKCWVNGGTAGGMEVRKKETGPVRNTFLRKMVCQTDLFRIINLHK